MEISFAKGTAIIEIEGLTHLDGRPITVSPNRLRLNADEFTASTPDGWLEVRAISSGPITYTEVTLLAGKARYRTYSPLGSMVGWHPWISEDSGDDQNDGLGCPSGFEENRCFSWE